MKKVSPCCHSSIVEGTQKHYPLGGQTWHETFKIDVCESCGKEVEEPLTEMTFEFYDFFISPAYGYLGQFVEEGDDDAWAYEAQFEVDEEQDRFIFNKFITKPSHFEESDVTDEMKRQLEDLVSEHYKPSDDVAI